MKVRELIEALKEMPQDMEVIIYSDIEAISFELENVKAYENKVYIGEIEEEYLISPEELYTEYNNSQGKLKEFWRRMYHYSSGFYHHNANGKRISIVPHFNNTLTGEGVLFDIEEGTKKYKTENFEEVKAFVEKYIDFIMDGVTYDNE